MTSADQVDEEMASYSSSIFFALGIVRIGLACFGVVANILSVTVLIHKSMRSSTAVLLISLAVYDTVFLVATAVVAIVGLQEYLAISMMLAIFYPIRYIAQMGSVYVTVVVTIERFIVVAYPIKARIICTLSNSRILMIVVFIFCVAFNIPRCLVFLMVPQMNTTANATIPLDSDMFFLYSRVYENYLSTILYFIIPYNMIVFLNIGLLMTLRKSKKTTLKLSSHRDRRDSIVGNPTEKEESLTSIVIGITGCFFVCCFIPMVYNLIVLSKPNLLDEATMYYLISVGDTMLCINSATNFIFYCLLGQRFRRIFMRKFCYFRKRRTLMTGT